MSSKIDITAAKTVSGSRYPPPYHEPCMARVRRCLGDVAGLTHFGVNLTRLPPGAWSSQRHWHSAEDEFIYIIQGELVLVTDSGEETLGVGDCAGFKASVANAHHLQNRGTEDAFFLEIGSRRPEQDEVTYSDIDLRAPKGRAGYTHTNGEPYSDAKRRTPPTGK
jgi:uncharacterized cupin superfamily protein